MREFLISDNIDTAMGFRLVGVDGVVVHSKEEVIDCFNKVLDDSNIALIMITRKLFNICSDVIYKLKRSKKTQIVQIPDRHSSDKPLSDELFEHLKNALGFSLSQN